MKLLTAAAVLALLAIAAPGPVASAQTADFQWSGIIQQGSTLEIRGVNGSVRAVASPDGTTRVDGVRRARRSDPKSVRIEVVEHAGGTTICAVYPTPRGASRQNRCSPGGSGANNQNNDVQVDFTVQVPAGVAFSGNTVNGNVQSEGLRSDVTATTVNGGVEIETAGFVSRISTVNGNVSIAVPSPLNAAIQATTVNGSIDSDFPITAQGRMGRRSVRGTIGNGGEEMRISTVNGTIRLRRN
jgi:hypothetical protein